MQKALDDHKRAGEALAAKLFEFAADTTVPLDERWSLFIGSGMGFVETGNVNFSSLGCLQEDICADRYEPYSTVDVEELLQWLEEHEFQSMHERLHTIVAFKEEVLSRGISGFTYNY
jgi:hypothetical protein